MAERTRRVLVTGAGRGIGRSIASELADAGFAVVGHYRSSQAAARALCEEIRGRGGDARAIGFDVADRAACDAALAVELEEHGPFWGVVVNAGIADDAAFAQMTGEQWDRVLGTNLDGFYNVVRPLVMPMVRDRRGGRVVVISSASARIGTFGQANYAASKGGLEAAARTLARELAKRGIAVNAIAPGYVESDMTAELPLAEIREQVPMRRLGRPEEVASLVRWLFSDGAGYVTGQTIAMDGGLG